LFDASNLTAIRDVVQFLFAGCGRVAKKLTKSALENCHSKVRRPVFDGLESEVLDYVNNRDYWRRELDVRETICVILINMHLSTAIHRLYTACPPARQ